MNLPTDLENTQSPSLPGRPLEEEGAASPRADAAAAAHGTGEGRGGVVGCFGYELLLGVGGGVAAELQRARSSSSPGTAVCFANPQPSQIRSY